MLISDVCNLAMLLGQVLKLPDGHMHSLGGFRHLETIGKGTVKQEAEIAGVHDVSLSGREGGSDEAYGSIAACGGDGTRNGRGVLSQDIPPGFSL